jgi:oligopeptide transport system permease protein
VMLFAHMSSTGDSAFGLAKLAVAISLGSWMTFARLTRNLVLREKNLLYVEAAVAVGAGPGRILTREILPNILPSLLVMFGLQIPNFLLFESFLSFLGLGVQPPLSSWGILIQEGWKSMLAYPYLLACPALILFLTVLSLNLVFERFRNHLLRPFAPVELHH